MSNPGSAPRPSLHEWLLSLSDRINEALDLEDALSRSRSEQQILESSAARLQTENADLHTRVVSLEAEIERLKAPNAKPAPTPDPGPDKPKPTPALEPAHVVPFTVKNTLNQPRIAEYVSVSIPLPEAWNVTSVDTLAVCVSPSYRSDVTPTEPALVPADIRPVAWWDLVVEVEGEDRTVIQCVVVEFMLPAEIPPSGVARFELLVGVPKNINPASVPVLQVKHVGANVYTIDTGRGVFCLDAFGIWDKGGKILSDHFDVIQGCETVFEGESKIQLPDLRSIKVEYAGPLVAHIIVTGYTGHTFGPGPHNHVTFTRRYTFHADSSLVLCRESLQWEGTWNGGAPKKADSGWNAILGTLWRERFTLSSPVASVVVLDTGGEVARLGSNSLPLTLAQDLRPQRLTLEKGGLVAYPRQFRLEAATGTSGNGQEGGLVSCKTERGTFTAIIKDMHRMEPCAIGISGSTINLDLASDRFHLAHHQGVYQTYALDILDSTSPTPDLLSIWAQVNHPLVGLCEVSHYNASGTFSPLPEFQLVDLTSSVSASALLESGLNQSLEEVCSSTLQKRDLEGLWGLTTYGLYPSYWGEWGVGSGQIGGANKTPDTWSTLYTDTAWADYWHACRLAWDAAVRLSRPELLSSILYPAALRMLHTMILQGDPQDPLTYLGGAPMGYGAYRSDFNSSHQYWESLFQYYYLTGDISVPATIERAAKYECERMLNDSSLTMSGRQPGQWIAAARFLSHVSTSGYDWQGTYLRLMREQIRRHYLPIDQMKGAAIQTSVLPHAIWTEQPHDPANPRKPIRTQQTWTIGIMDMEGLWWFAQETDNAPHTFSGSSITPQEIILSCARAMMTLGSILAGNKTIDPKGPWVRIFDVTLSTDGKGPYVFAGVIDWQTTLFPDDIPALCAWMSRAALYATKSNAPDAPALRSLSRSLVQYAFTRVLGRGLPMGKLSGLICARLSAAVWTEQEIDKLTTTTPGAK